MKFKQASILKFLTVCSGPIAAMALQSAHAVTYVWDENGVTSGFGIAGNTGTSWSSSTSLFATDNTSGTTAPSGLQVTTTSDQATFGKDSTNPGLAAGTIAVSGTVNIGTIRFGSGSGQGAIALSGGTINFGATGTINGNAAGATISSALTGAATSLSFAATGGSGGISLAGGYTGGGSFIISGTGSVTLTAGTYTVGGVTSGNSDFRNLNLNGGTLQTAGNVFASGTAGNLAFAGGTLQSNNAAGITVYDFNNSIGLGTGGGTFNAANGNISFGTGVILTGSGGLTKSGGGTLTLSGANTTSGVTNINAGTLVANHAQALGTSGNIVFGGGTLQYGSGITTDYSSRIASGTSGSAVAIDTNGNAVTFATGFTATKSGGLTKLGSGTLSLTAANSYTGGTTVSVGTLSVSGSGTLGNTSNALTVGATLDLNGTAQNVGVLSGAGTIDNLTTGTTNTLTFGTGNGTGGDFSGAIKNTTGTLSVTKTGSGTQTLSGANTYTGATNVNGGALMVSNASGLGTGGNVTVASGANLGLSGGINVSGHQVTISGTGNNGALRSLSGSNTWTGDVVLGSNGARVGAETGATLTIDGVISGAGNGLTVRNADATGKIILKGANTYSGATSIINGTLQLASGNDRLATDQILTMGSGLAQNAVLDLNGLNQKVAGLAVNSGNNSTLIIDNVTAGGTSALTIDGTGSNTFSGVIKNTTGTVSLTKAGSGTQTLSGTNTYSGTTTVDAGKLLVTGSIGNSAVTLHNSGTILASDAAATIGSSLTLNAGTILAAGDAGAAGTATVSGNTRFNDGSIFSWDINSDGTSFDKLITATLTDGAPTGGSTFRVVAADSAFSNPFWSTTRSWGNIITTDGATAISNWADTFTTVSLVDSGFNTIAPSNGSFSVSGSTLTWTAVPEPTSALAGLLIGAGLLRRRRA